MSGGHFDYAQYRIEDIATEIDELIARNNDMNEDEFGGAIGYDYPSDIIAKFKETSKTLRLAAAMTQRVDWLVCGDDGEESFRTRWIEEVGTLR